MKRYFLAVFIIFAVLAIGIVLLFGGSGDKKTDTPTANATKQLHEYAGSAVSRVVYTTQGAVVADDRYQSIRVTVARDYRRVEVLDSYTNRVHKTKTFPNNQAAFDIFLRSLEQSGYSMTKRVDITDERGVCAAGNRYIYEAIDGDKELQRSWSTSCGAKLGTFGGNSSAVMQLFQAQITDYDNIVSGVMLR